MQKIKLFRVFCDIFRVEIIVKLPVKLTYKTRL
jgi:hypothetical protein